jgi:hypothetical protein
VVSPTSASGSFCRGCGGGGGGLLDILDGCYPGTTLRLGKVPENGGDVHFCSGDFAASPVGVEGL